MKHLIFKIQNSVITGNDIQFIIQFKKRLNN